MKRKTPRRAGHAITTKVVKPRISVITPVYNIPPAILCQCVESVLSQTSSRWELILCDDASTNAGTQEVLSQFQGFDGRIKVVRNSRNLHIADASNRAVSFATGEFVAFLDHDDALAPNAIESIQRAITEFPDTDLLYTDEDKIDFDGSLCDPYIKPDWSPEHLLSVMYVLHLLVVRKSIFLSLGGFRAKYSGAQDYDLALRVSRVARRVHHVPEILYHWRKVEGSAAAEVDAKPYALTAGKRALQDFIGTKGQVEDGLLPGFFRVRYHLPKEAPVTLLFLSGDARKNLNGQGEVSLLQHALLSISNKTSYPDYRIVVVHNNDLSQESLDLIDKLGGIAVADTRAGGFNYSRRLNFGFQHVETEYVVTLNDDIEIIQADWLEALVEWLVPEDIGVVGARLLYPDALVQHAGMALIPTSGATHPFFRMPRDTIGYNGFTHLVKNVSAVTGAVMATKMSIVREVLGFDEHLSTDFNDVDFCLKVWSAGRRIVWTPFCEVIHHEGSSLKRTSQNPYEVELFSSRWKQLTERDPYIDLPKIKSIMPWAIDPNNTAPV
jgi:GT2 family glycosyltransferase